MSQEEMEEKLRRRGGGVVGGIVRRGYRGETSEGNMVSEGEMVSEGRFGRDREPVSRRLRGKRG
jgi:hypothetical protein